MNKDVRQQLIIVFINITLYTMNIHAYGNQGYSQDLRLFYLLMGAFNLTVIMWFLNKRFQEHEELYRAYFSDPSRNYELYRKMCDKISLLENKIKELENR